MEKQRREESERRREEETRLEKRKSEKKEDAGVRKGRKVAKHCVFPMICGSGGSKSRLAKAAGAEPSGQMWDEKLHAVVARSTFQIRFEAKNAKMYTHTPHFRNTWKLQCPKVHAVVARNTFRCQNVHTPHVRNTFGGCDVEQVHGVVARSTFRTQNVQNTSVSKHFWKLTCRSTFRSQNVQNTPSWEHFWKLRCRKSMKKCTLKSAKNWRVRSTFGHSDVVSRGRREQNFKTWRFCSISKNDGRRGTFEEDP